MLTHGYRRFEWKQVLNNRPATATNKPEKALVISDVVKKIDKPLASAKVKLFGKGKDALVLDTVTNTDGRFVFDNLVFGDKTKFILQARSTKGDKEVDVEPDKVFDGLVIINAIMPTTEGKQAAVSYYVQDSRQFRDEQKKYGVNEHTQMLKEVTIKDKKITPLEHSKNLNGPGKTNKMLTSKDLEKKENNILADCLQGVLNGVFFIRSSIGYAAYLYLYNSVSYHPRPMAYMIDGVFVNADDFSNLHAEDIEGIEVITDPHYGAVYGTRGADGILMATNKTASRVKNNYRDAPGVVTYTPKNKKKTHEFYSPQFDNPLTNQNLADFRS